MSPTCSSYRPPSTPIFHFVVEHVVHVEVEGDTGERPDICRVAGGDGFGEDLGALLVRRSDHNHDVIGAVALYDFLDY